MKNLIISFLFLLLFSSCSQHSKNNSWDSQDYSNAVKSDNGYTSIEFEETEFDFGSYSIQEERAHIFVFTNKGNAPLVIQKVETTCSCIHIDYPKLPVEPKQRGEIKILYRALQKRGHFHRNVYVFSNGSDQPVTLRISGYQY